MFQKVMGELSCKPKVRTKKYVSEISHHTQSEMNTADLFSVLPEHLLMEISNHSDKPNTKMSTGTVKWFNPEKGFGFITPDDGGADLFVHHSAIESSGYANLDEGQKVKFEIGQGQKGPCAEKVESV